MFFFLFGLHCYWCYCWIWIVNFCIIPYFSATPCNYFWFIWVIAVLWFCFTLISAFILCSNICYSLLQYSLSVWCWCFKLVIFWCFFNFFWYDKRCGIVFDNFLVCSDFFLVYFVILLRCWVDGLAIYTQYFIDCQISKW